MKTTTGEKTKKTTQKKNKRRWSRKREYRDERRWSRKREYRDERRWLLGLRKSRKREGGGRLRERWSLEGGRILDLGTAQAGNEKRKGRKQKNRYRRPTWLVAYTSPGRPSKNVRVLGDQLGWSPKKLEERQV